MINDHSQAARPEPHFPVDNPSDMQTVAGEDSGGITPGREVLVTKLSRPVLNKTQVPRNRLLDRLNTIYLKPVTLVSATAGWGKTTLLAEWAEQQTFPVAWLALDELDDDLSFFWISVISALRRDMPGLGETPLGMLRSTKPVAPPVFLTALLNEMARLSDLERPLTLVLDDYHLIEDAAIHESLIFWTEHFPPNFHLVVASRLDPPFPLARWRVKGRLAEIRVADLSFTEAEATFFLENSGQQSLSRQEISTLLQRTQGWVAGLQLAALSLENQADKSGWIAGFSGTNRYLLDYVEEEILKHQPENIQKFLLQTAVLHRLNGEICEAVTGESSSQELLETLERNNLFIIALDDRRQWYRFHDLFREALLARLQLKQPELVPVLRRNAARWYAEHGESREAIAQALAASDFEMVANLLEDSAAQFWVTGQGQAVFNWVELLPDAILLEHARLALDAALHLSESLIATSKTNYLKIYNQVEQLNSRLEKLVVNPPWELERFAAHQHFDRDLIRRRIRLLQALFATRTSLLKFDVSSLRQLVEEAENLSETEDLNWQWVGLSLAFWLTESMERRGSLMTGRLLAVKQQAIKIGDKSILLTIKNRLAYAYMRAGQFRLCVQECQEGLALIEQTGELTPSEGYFHFFLGQCYANFNHLEEAMKEAQAVVRVGELWQQIDLQIIGNIDVVEVNLMWGNLPAADQALQNVEKIIKQEQNTLHTYFAMGVRAQFWLENGELKRAREWAERIEFSPRTWNPNQFWGLMVQVMTFLALHNYRHAVEILETFSPVLDRPKEDLQTTIMFLATYLKALHLDGKTHRAQTIAARLLPLTYQTGSLRVILEGGEPMRQFLQSLLLKAPQDFFESGNPDKVTRSYVEQLIRELEQNLAHKNLAARNDGSLKSDEIISGDTSKRTGEAALWEQLSQQEQRVLRLLAAGQTYGEIAEELVVSINTIKTQVTSIYRKLGVNRRLEAIELVKRRQVG